jgi:hypothetical protein
LRDTNYKIEKITLDQARQNGECIRLSNSELIRAIQRIRGIDYNQAEVDDLIRKKKKRKSNSFINEQLDKLLYIDDIISVEFDDSRHYKTIINKGGIFINNKKYIRLLCGAGMARRSTVIFANEEIIKDLKQFLNCDRNPNYKISPAKFNAYYSLASTSTLKVSTPKFVIIPDCEIDRTIKVDFLHQTEDMSKDPKVYEEDITIKVNVFDGQGLLSPSLAKKWASEIEVEYIPSEFIFRSAFSKGLLITFDFLELARQNNIYTITDVYGNNHNIEDVEVILSASQAKMWQAYDNINDYNQKSEKNNFSWGLTRISPRIEKDHCYSTYQYVQNLNLSNNQISSLCKKTVDWFKNVTGDDWIYTTLFLMGDINKDRISTDWFDKLDNPLLQSLLLEPKLINDVQIQNKIQRLINKKIKDSYLGVLLLEGNYQHIFIDPYAQAQWGLGLQITGMLQEGESYSAYWNEKKISKVSAIRSPMTFRSENNILNLKNNKELSYWYQYLNSGIVFNAFGTDMMRMSGADGDGDACMTTSQKEFVDGSFLEYVPPAYERKSAEKKLVIEEELWEYDAKTFKSKIGLITNISTQLFAMLPLFEENSEEYSEILNRLKICNCFQSMEIDRAKGIQTMDIPRYWTKWEKINGDEPVEELHIKELHHKTICDKRPYFFRYLYQNYENEYKERLSGYNNYCKIMFDGDLNYIINKENKNDEELRIIRNYYQFGNLLDSDCVMNKLCHHMENEVQLLKKNNKLKSFDFKSIVDNNVEFKQKNRIVISNIHDKYRQFKKNINYHSNTSGFQGMMIWLRNQAESIVASSDEIVYWASEFGSSFLLDVFGDDLAEVLKEYSNRKILVPIKDEEGYIDYMGSKYEIKRISL